jgi:hypothetical protein
MQNQKTLTIAAILGAAVLIAGIFAAATTPLTAYADKDNKKDKGDVSKTITKQKLYQKNDGSGHSTNANCGQNTINSLAVGVCPDASVTNNNDNNRRNNRNITDASITNNNDNNRRNNSRISI